MAIYFVTDFHLGIPSLEDSQKRERKLLRFLDMIRDSERFRQATRQVG